MKKLEIIYPDGNRDCQKVVANTFRKAIEYIGLEKVRDLDIYRNSINIVSTRVEMKQSLGKKEIFAISRLKDNTDLGVCTQFSTEEKLQILKQINKTLNVGLQLVLIEKSEKEAPSMNN